MATIAYGRMQEFLPESETSTAYLEQLQIFFAANDVSDAKRVPVPVLLSVIGMKTYALLRSLLAPHSPTEQDFDTLVQTLKMHFDPKPLVIVESFYFYWRNQAADETMAAYVAELCRLSAHCEFGDFLEDALCDRFVCGLRSEGIQKHLLAEDKVTFTRALEIAQGREAADRNAKALKGSELAAVNAVYCKTVNKPPKRVSCRHCG